MPSAFLLSFELLLLFAVPALVIAAALAIHRWSLELARKILGVLVLLAVVQGAYLAYYFAGLTEVLWASGIYFSANDVLHVGMLIWLAITWALLRHRLADLSAPRPWERWLITAHRGHLSTISPAKRDKRQRALVGLGEQRGHATDTLLDVGITCRVRQSQVARRAEGFTGDDRDLGLVEDESGEFGR